MSLIKLDVIDYIAVVTIDNPPVNAAPMEMLQELTETFDSFNDRDDVRVAILTGAGKIFSGGADLKQRPDFSIQGFRSRRNRIVREVGYAISDNAKPTITAVNGPALGAGLGLVASCDIIVASERAVFGLPEIDVGLMGGAVTIMSPLACAACAGSARSVALAAAGPACAYALDGSATAKIEALAKSATLLLSNIVGIIPSPKFVSKLDGWCDVLCRIHLSGLLIALRDRLG